MRGDNWDGTPVDISKELRPVIDALLQHQAAQGITGRDVSVKAGQCHSWQAELISKLKNPRLGRLCRWAHLINTQELGLFLGIGGEYSTHPMYDIDQPLPWTINSSNRQIPDFREPLQEFVAILRRHRRAIAPTVDGFIKARRLETTRSVVSGTEWGHRSRSPAVGHMLTWAKAVGAQEFGLYVVIGGTLTEADLIGGDNE